MEILPQLNPKEFFRPAQVDRFGNFSSVVIGDYHVPKMRLPGSVGIPDVTNDSKTIYMYVPRYSPRVFVEKVDFVSGIGLSNA
jgi:glutaconate CoA-transferase subunit B